LSLDGGRSLTVAGGRTPSEARRVAKDYVVKKEAVPSDARVRVSDFGHLVDGSYSVLVDVAIHASSLTRYRVKMDKNGRITSFVAREERSAGT
jgi:hypothetical protein